MNNKTTMSPASWGCVIGKYQKEIRFEYKDPQEKVPPHFRHPLGQSGGTSEEKLKENQVGENHIFQTKWESETSGLVTELCDFFHGFGQAAWTPDYSLLPSA